MVADNICCYEFHGELSEISRFQTQPPSQRACGKPTRRFWNSKPPNVTITWHGMVKPNRRSSIGAKTRRVLISTPNLGNCIMTAKRAPEREYAEGVIREHLAGLEFAVHLDDGREVTAVLPKAQLRKNGCLFGNLVGWRVTIEFRVAPKPLTIIELAREKGKSLISGDES